MREDRPQFAVGDKRSHAPVINVGQGTAARRIGKAEIKRQLRQIRHAVTPRLGRLAQYLIDLGAGVDVEIGMPQIEHAKNTGPPLHFPVVAHIRQIYSSYL
jgi:hypothetical protein